LKESERNSQWFDKHYDELQGKYVDRIIAIKNQNIIVAKKELGALLNELKHNNEDLSRVYITSIPPKGIGFIL